MSTKQRTGHPTVKECAELLEEGKRLQDALRPRIDAMQRSPEAQRPPCDACGEKSNARGRIRHKSDCKKMAMPPGPPDEPCPTQAVTPYETPCPACGFTGGLTHQCPTKAAPESWVDRKLRDPKMRALVEAEEAVERAATDAGDFRVLKRYQRCAIRIWELFPSDPLGDDPAHFYLERLEALLDRGLLAPCTDYPRPGLEPWPYCAGCHGKLDYSCDGILQPICYACAKVCRQQRSETPRSPDDHEHEKARPR